MSWCGKKIKPINRPDLVLKTPLAYNGVSDLSILPIEKDGIGVCERCGAVGVKHAFYSRQRRFCSQKCARSYTGLIYANSSKIPSHKFKLIGDTDHLVGMIPMEPIPQLEAPWPVILDDLMQPAPIRTSHISNSYEWSNELFGCDFLAAPVKLFKHAPLFDMWDNTFEGMKVEVKNTDCENYSERLSDFFWVATVIKVKGYMGLLRYEGFGTHSIKDFWVNLCCSEVHPVGWCATRGKPLIPPKSIEDKYADWKKFLVKQLTGARTLPADFYSKFSDSLKSRFRIGTMMEVVDKNRISQVKVASVYEIIGKRLHIKYYDSSPDDNGFWCHEDSPLIHPVGWAYSVGHVLDGSQEYCERVAAGLFEPNDATPDMFFQYPDLEFSSPIFQEGMKIEAIDPLNLSSVCAATVMRVLHEGYMMIRIDCYPADASGADWFCYHQRSPCIFPVGFSAANSIPLIPPSGFDAATFDWVAYVEASGAPAAGPELFAPRSSVQHGFVSGMRLECADLMDPRLVCVATVSRVVANLLKVHFDGWGEEYDQWLAGSSTDMYPVGWCRAVGHRLEGPLAPAPPPRAPRRRPAQRAPRRRKLLQSAAAAVVPSETFSSDSQQSSQLNEEMVTGPEPLDVDLSASNDAALIDEQDEEDVLCPLEKPEEEIVAEEKEAIEGPMELEELFPSLPQETQDDKKVPRLVGGGAVELGDCSSPAEWTARDVARFLQANDCAPYTSAFTHVDGPRLLTLTKDQIIEMLQMKVGPSLKIFDLIQQLKCKFIPGQNRIKSGFK